MFLSFFLRQSHIAALFATALLLSFCPLACDAGIDGRHVESYTTTPYIYGNMGLKVHSSVKNTGSSAWYGTPGWYLKRTINSSDPFFFGSGVITEGYDGAVPIGTTGQCDVEISADSLPGTIGIYQMRLDAYCRWSGSYANLMDDTGRTVQFEVTPPFSQISVSVPASAAAGTSRDLTSTLHLEGGGTRDISAYAIWEDDSVYVSVSGEGVMSVDADVPDGHTVVISATYGSQTVSSSPITLRDASVLPSIVTPPESAATVEPLPLTFQVEASGEAPLSYQWLRNGVHIAGATGQTLVLDPTLAGRDDGARIGVKVSNSYGSVRSGDATLSVTGDVSLVRHVWTNSPSPRAPYSTWRTAAHSIQEAVDTCADGALVLVTNGLYSTPHTTTPGGYSKNVLVVDRDVTVRSVSGPAHTVIAGQPDDSTDGVGYGAVRGVYLGAGTLDGFTVANGYTRPASANRLKDVSGGGIFAMQGSVSNCIVQACAAGSFGGGLFCYGAMTVRSLQLSGNEADDGGGIYFNDGGRIEDSEVAANRAAGNGGGVCALGGATVERCTVVSNRATFGAGIYGQEATVEICELRDNEAGSTGGGLYIRTGTVVTQTHVMACSAIWGGGAYVHGEGTIVGSSFVGNRAIRVDDSGGYGAGVYLNGGAIHGSTVNSNEADYAGGGLHLAGAAEVTRSEIHDNQALFAGGLNLSDGRAMNCLIYANEARSAGGGVYDLRDSSLVNVTCVTNVAPYGAGLYSASTNSIHVNTIVRQNVTNDAIGGEVMMSAEGVLYRYCSLPYPPSGATGTVVSPVRFMDARGSDFRLRADSPCVDAGTNVNDVGGADLDAYPRLYGDHVDIGAYEYGTGPDSDGDSLVDAWEVAYGTDRYRRDTDGDGQTDGQEVTADTDPTSARDFLRIRGVSLARDGISVDWRGGRAVHQILECTTSLNPHVAEWIPIFTNIPPTEVDVSVFDRRPRYGRIFYRIRVPQ